MAACVLSVGSWSLVPERAEQTSVSKNCIWSYAKDCHKALAFLEHTVKQTISYEQPATAGNKLLQRPTIDVPKSRRKSWGDSSFGELEQSKLISSTGEFRKPHAHPGQDTCYKKI